MIVYIAAPYSHPEKTVRDARFEDANRISAKIMKKGHTVFSPISHSHPIAKYLPEDLLMSWDFWKAQDFPWLEKSDVLMVLTSPGWKESRGVQAEISHAQKCGIPIRFIGPGYAVSAG